MPRTPLSLLLLAAAIGASSSAYAQTPPCGTTLTRSVTFNAHMLCPASVDALVIGAHNVAIDLNGYNIIDPNGGATRGVVSSGFDGTKIVGPGSITGFFTPVMIDGGGSHEIREIDVRGFGILLRNISGSVVEKSRVGVLELGSDPGYSASANRIVGNDADSIHLYGCQTYKNVIADNDIHPVTQFQALSLFYGAHDNQVIANRIVSGTVRLGGSSDNLVTDNIIDNRVYPSWTIHAGVFMIGDPSPCAGGALVDATRNVLRANTIIGGQMGVGMMAGSRQNKIVDNKIHNQRAVGLQFFPDSDDNDAHSNSYSHIAVVVDVVDLGRGNVWP
jgi:nitrous oxidase accessory protein NosD